MASQDLASGGGDLAAKQARFDRAMTLERSRCSRGRGRELCRPGRGAELAVQKTTLGNGVARGTPTNAVITNFVTDLLTALTTFS